MTSLIQEEKLNLELYENLIKVINHVIKNKALMKKSSPNEYLYNEPMLVLEEENDYERITRIHFCMKNVSFCQFPTSDNFHDNLECSFTVHYKKKLPAVEIFHRMGVNIYMQFFFRSYEDDTSTFSYNNRHELLTIIYNWLHHLDTNAYSHEHGICGLMQLRTNFQNEKDIHSTDATIQKIIEARDPILEKIRNGEENI